MAPHITPSPKTARERPWIRLYIETLDHPKIRSLPDKLRLTWIDLLCLAGKGGGGLPEIRHISWALRISVAETRSRLSALVSAGLLDVINENGETLIIPHDWSKWQFVSDNSTSRVRKFRSKRDLAVTETFQETLLKRPPSVSGSESVVCDLESIHPGREISRQVTVGRAGR